MFRRIKHTLDGTRFEDRAVFHDDDLVCHGPDHLHIVRDQEVAQAALALEALRTEMEPGESREKLLREVDLALAQAAAKIRAIDPDRLAEPRVVGRKRLPTTVIGLAVHIAEHTQRHVGQAISAAKWARTF